jgi:hypothetical protein
VRRYWAIAVLSLLLVGAVPQIASATHRPSAACSPSGDVCQSVTKVDGVRKLRIVLAAEFFTRYTLCVTGPDLRECHRFRVHEAAAGTFAGSVRWRDRFTVQGPGAYTVVWRSGGSRVGRILGFHVR